MARRFGIARLRRDLAPLLGDGELRAYYLAFAALWFAAAAYTQALPLYFQELGISLAVLGLARSIANVATIATEAPAGLLADRVDRASIAVVAFIALGALLLALPLARSALALGAIVVAVAVARQFVTNGVTPAVSEALPSDRSGLGWGLRDVGMYGGSALGLVVAAAATAGSGSLSVAFLPGALVVLGGAVVVWVRAATPELSWPSPGRLVERGRERLAATSPIADFREVSNWSVLRQFCVVEALVTSAGGLSIFLLPALAGLVGFPPAAVLGLFAASNLFGAPLSLLGGALADRYSRKWLYVGNYAAETAMLAAFAGAATVATSPAGPPLFVLGLGLYVVQTAFEPAVIAYFFDQFPDDEAGRAWSVEGLVSRFTGVVAPAVGGILYAVEPRLVFLAAALLMAAGTAVAVTLPE